jgi:hypothetical protein
MRSGPLTLISRPTEKVLTEKRRQISPGEGHDESRLSLLSLSCFRFSILFGKSHRSLSLSSSLYLCDFPLLLNESLGDSRSVVLFISFFSLFYFSSTVSVCRGFYFRIQTRRLTTSVQCDSTVGPGSLNFEKKNMKHKIKVEYHTRPK